MNRNLFQTKYIVDLQESNKAIVSSSTEIDSNKVKKNQIKKLHKI